jgi:transcriptional regulator with XRE-family HTH domain
MKDVAVSELSPVVRRRRLGARLRQIRERLSLTGEQAARSIDRSASWLSRLEAGQIGIRSKELHELLDEYGVQDRAVRQELESLAAEGRRRAWWSPYRESLPEDYYRYIGLEAEAIRLDWVGNAAIPGWLQTEDYARALHLQMAPTIPHPVQEDRINVRMRRQRLVFGPEALPLHVVIGEGVLRRHVGGGPVLHGQLARLASAAERPNVQIQILPEASPASAMMPLSLTIITLPGAEIIVHLENPMNGFFQEGDQANQYLALHRSLAAAALDAGASRLLLAQVQREVAEATPGSSNADQSVANE